MVELNTPGYSIKVTGLSLPSHYRSVNRVVVVKERI